MPAHGTYAADGPYADATNAGAADGAYAYADASSAPADGPYADASSAGPADVVRFSCEAGLGIWSSAGATAAVSWFAWHARVSRNGAPHDGLYNARWHPTPTWFCANDCANAGNAAAPGARASNGPQGNSID